MCARSDNPGLSHACPAGRPIDFRRAFELTMRVRVTCHHAERAQHVTSSHGMLALSSLHCTVPITTCCPSVSMNKFPLQQSDRSYADWISKRIASCSVSWHGP